MSLSGMLVGDEKAGLSHSILPPAVILRSLPPGRTLGTCSEYTLLVCMMPNMASLVCIGRLRLSACWIWWDCLGPSVLFGAGW